IQHPRADHLAEAGVLGVRDRHRRPVRRRGPDHLHRRRDGLADRPTAAGHRERAQGAAAGMAAVFGAPVASLVLAVELLLFELRPRSLIPVALATVTAVGVRYAT